VGVQTTAADDIAVAYGRRSIPKLLSALSRSGLPDAETLRCLRALSAVINTQEQKACAIQDGAVPLIAQKLRSQNSTVAQRACKALTKLVVLMRGREELVRGGGVESLAAVLQQMPVLVSRCLQAMSETLAGARMILESEADVVAELASACKARGCALAVTHVLLVHCCGVNALIVCSAWMLCKAQLMRSHLHLISRILPFAGQTLTGHARCFLQTLGFDGSAWKAKQIIAHTLAMVGRSNTAVPVALAAGVPDLIVAFAEASFESTFPEQSRQAMQRSCVECLLQLSHTVEGKAGVRAAGGIPVLGRLLRSGDSVTVGKALYAFMCLTIDNESKQATLEVRACRLCSGRRMAPTPRSRRCFEEFRMKRAAPWRITL
jgi:hypothetical protein